MIIQWPDKTLSRVSKPVEDIALHRDVVEEMKLLVRARTAWGLSAVQVGVLERFCVVRYGSDIVLLVNPEITKRSKQTCWVSEGCLSLAEGKLTRVMGRHKRVTVKFMGDDGLRYAIRGNGIFAAVLQHEIDHMDGIMINDPGSAKGP